MPSSQLKNVPLQDINGYSLYNGIKGFDSRMYCI